MIKIIVAEDQALQLASLCKKIEACDSNIDIVAKCLNGQDALDKIIQFKPDIVFTDVNMPILNGLELIKKVRLLKIKTKFVIISGYKEFDYVKEALKYDVDEYLLKPITTENIVNLLSTLLENLNSSKIECENNFIKELLSGSSNYNLDDNYILNFKNYAILHLNIGTFYDFLIDEFINYDSLKNEILLEKILNSYISTTEKYFIINGQNTNEIIIFLASNNLLSQTLISISNELLKVKNKFDLTICQSKIFNDLNLVSIYAQITRATLKNNLIFNKSSLIDCSYTNIQNSKNRLFIDANKQKRILVYMNSNQFSYLLTEYKDLVLDMKKNNAKQSEVNKNIKHFINIMQTHKINTELYFDLMIEEAISKSLNYIDLEKNLNFVIENIFKEYIAEFKKKNNNTIFINSIKIYIENNISDDLNVNDLATKFAISPTYLSRLFKKEIGISPISYINKVKMSKACFLLKNKNLSVKEVAEICGYSDQFYFSKTFKNNIGVSPSQFK